jgi:hypothetical protein
VLSLDSYGHEVLERLKNCQNEAEVWTLLAEANEALHGSRLSTPTRRMFWQTLRGTWTSFSRKCHVSYSLTKLWC